MSFAKESVPLLLPDSEEMGRMDRAMVESGVSELILVKRAAAGIFRVIKQCLLSNPFNRIKKALILVGPGNNGADGLALAGHLVEGGLVVEVLLVLNAKEISAEMLKFITSIGAEIFIYKGSVLSKRNLAKEDLRVVFEGADLIVDALLGTGQRATLRGEIAEVMGELKAFRDSGVQGGSDNARYLAIDVPTGVEASSGEVDSACFRADLTCAIQFIKRGMLQPPARNFCGRIEVVDIGIEPSVSCKYKILNSDLLKHMPRRDRYGHKGLNGRVLIMGGSVAMKGASALAAVAALKFGAALVTCTRPEGESLAHLPPEIMTLPLVTMRGVFAMAQNISRLVGALEKIDCLVIGPGIGGGVMRGDLEARKSLLSLFEKVVGEAIDRGKKILIDAEGLDLMVEIGLKFSPELVVITPHPGEALRILDISLEELAKDRYGAAEEMARRFGATTILKGAGTIITDGERGYVSPFASAHLSTGGSGDVLSGMIGGFMAQGVISLKASALAVYLHGAGVSDLEERMPYKVASDLISLSLEQVESRLKF
ncbi:MAG TPA: NAD(P)H-hydrate dehydratase [Oligoflexia bacterium]|nr:NAD(P)H-hydrate dehydratase [Oligoflexia bacterium]HMP27621.1 NAD(P)H-hydrate dehydratase [Oligoflexia bacterium]